MRRVYKELVGYQVSVEVDNKGVPVQGTLEINGQPIKQAADVPRPLITQGNPRDVRALLHAVGQKVQV